MFMVLVQANGRDSPQECPLDRLRNTEDPFRNGSRTHSSAAGDMRSPGISWGTQNALPRPDMNHICGRFATCRTGACCFTAT